MLRGPRAQVSCSLEKGSLITSYYAKDERCGTMFKNTRCLRTAVFGQVKHLLDILDAKAMNRLPFQA